MGKLFCRPLFRSTFFTRERNLGPSMQAAVTDVIDDVGIQNGQDGHEPLPDGIFRL